MKSISEEDIIAIKKGNTAPLSRIYEQHYMTCVNQMQRKMNASKEDAEDLMMDTILVLRDNIMSDSFKNENVGAYLLTVGINKWRNKIKRDRRLDEYDPGLIERKLNTQIEEDGPTNSRIKIIIKAMTMMKGNCQTLLNRNLVDGIPLKNLVSELGFKSYDVIKTTKSRCMKKLRTIVNERIQENG